ncbi:YdeI/OmpD-associated family protein [Cellulomonas sp. Marseille-Q8402]
MPDETLTVRDAAAWRAWLDAHEDATDGVWLVLARKGTVEPTSLTYAEALDEALCSGWIDGQKRSGDALTFHQRFSPRRARSLWSQRNIEHVARLVADGRMRPRGAAEVERARTDRRWERAYAGSAAAETPEDLLRALDAAPGARARFEALNRQERYSVLHPLMTAATPQTRQRRLARAVERLSAPEPQP